VKSALIIDDSAHYGEICGHVCRKNTTAAAQAAAVLTQGTGYAGSQNPAMHVAAAPENHLKSSDLIQDTLLP
jgi:hypothetical protein